MAPKEIPLCKGISCDWTRANFIKTAGAGAFCEEIYSNFTTIARTILQEGKSGKMLGWIIIPNQRRAKLNLLICRSCESMKFHFLPSSINWNQYEWERTLVKLNFSITPPVIKVAGTLHHETLAFSKGESLCYYTCLMSEKLYEFPLGSLWRKRSNTSKDPCTIFPVFDASDF